MWRILNGLFAVCYYSTDFLYLGLLWLHNSTKTWEVHSNLTNILPCWISYAKHFLNFRSDRGCMEEVKSCLILVLVITSRKSADAYSVPLSDLKRYITPKAAIYILWSVLLQPLHQFCSSTIHRDQSWIV